MKEWGSKIRGESLDSISNKSKYLTYVWLELLNMYHIVILRFKKKKKKGKHGKNIIEAHFPQNYQQNYIFKQRCVCIPYLL